MEYSYSPYCLEEGFYELEREEWGADKVPLSTKGQTRREAGAQSLGTSLLQRREVAGLPKKESLR